MQGAETPLHFDERENLFFQAGCFCRGIRGRIVPDRQVRGLKEIVVFPFVDYSKLYPFPTTHPCDRQLLGCITKSPLQNYMLLACLPASIG